MTLDPGRAKEFTKWVAKCGRTLDNPTPLTAAYCSCDTCKGRAMKGVEESPK